MDFFTQLSHNYVFIAALFGWFVAQTLKVIYVLLREHRWDFKRFIGSGGMPSSHASFVTSITTMVGLVNGFDSPLFAVCFVMACVVMYDAAGVRRAAGMQAKILNQMVDNWNESPEIQGKRLKELLGHTPFEVIAGAALGIFISLFLYIYVF